MIGEVNAEQARQRKLEAATVSFTQPGDADTEKNFNQQGEDPMVDVAMGQPARRGKKWFSFDLPVDAAHPNGLVVTYHREERSKRTFEILVDGQHVGEQVIEGNTPGSAAGRSFDVEYKIPADLLKNTGRVTVRFQATGNNEIAAVFGTRTIRAEAERQGLTCQTVMICSRDKRKRVAIIQSGISKRKTALDEYDTAGSPRGRAHRTITDRSLSDPGQCRRPDAPRYFAPRPKYPAQ